jgi:hypothetical protein
VSRNLIDRVRYEAWVNAGCTGPILPDFLRFALLEEKLTAAKCGDKYIIGKSRIWDVVKHTQIVDDEDLATAARYQYSTHKVSSIVLEIDTPSAVVTPTQGMSMNPSQPFPLHNINIAKPHRQDQHRPSTTALPRQHKSFRVVSARWNDRMRIIATKYLCV